MTVIVGGMCETDYSGYPDCRDDAVKAMQVALNIGMAQRFHRGDAVDVDRQGGDLGRWRERLGGPALIEIVGEQTHTCYVGDREHRHDWGYGCGTCPACTLRADGWTRWQAGASADHGVS